MNERTVVGAVTFRAAQPIDVLGGLLGFAGVEVNGLRLSSLGVRRTRAGAIVVTFPTRKDRIGREHVYVQPIEEETRRAIEAAVRAELERRGVLS